MTRSVVVVGSLNVDVLVHVPELRAPGQTARDGFAPIVLESLVQAGVAIDLVALGPTSDAVDTVGAGDAFVGALAVGYTDPTSVLDALRFANVDGGLAATRPGAQPAMPTLAEVQAVVDVLPGGVR